MELASRLRSYDRAGDAARQARIRSLGGRVAAQLLLRYRRTRAKLRPRAWLTYHAYHKSPDWLGPEVSAALGIPYLLAEASFAPKRRDGPWATGHAATEDAIRAADVVLALTAIDAECLAPLVVPPAELRRLLPFIDPAPFGAARSERARHRAELATRFGLDPATPWLLAVAMMREDVKRDSYLVLARALGEPAGPALAAPGGRRRSGPDRDRGGSAAARPGARPFRRGARRSRPAGLLCRRRPVRLARHSGGVRPRHAGGRGGRPARGRRAATAAWRRWCRTA